MQIYNFYIMHINI